MIVLQPILFILLSTGSEERGLLGVGIIPVAILQLYDNLKTIALYLHKHKYSWVIKKIKTLR